MKKGMLAGCMLVLLSGVPAVFAADHCPTETQSMEAQSMGVSGEHSTSKTSYLGVDVTDIDADNMAKLNQKEETGVEVLAVDQDAPAGKAGVKEHDVILAINGTKIESKEQLRRIIHETPPGRTINLLISRNGAQMTLKPTLVGRADMTAWSMPKMPDMPPMPPMPPMNFGETIEIPDVRVYTNLRNVGALVENLTPQLREFFGVKSGAGILVRSVEKGSPAELGGLKAGDVIVRVGQEPITDSGDWRRTMRNKSGNVTVGIVRDKRAQSVTLKLPARRETGQWESEDFDWNFHPDLNALRDELKNLPKITEEQKLAMLKAETEWKKDFEAHKGEWQKSIEQATREATQEQQKAMKDLQKKLEEMQKEFHYISFE